METLEALSRRIATTEERGASVRTVKSLPAVSIRQYEAAAAALHDYARTVVLALQALLRERARIARAPRPAPGPAVVVVVGSDHGLCGRFNDDIARFACDRLRELDAAGARGRGPAVGARGQGRLA